MKIVVVEDESSIRNGLAKMIGRLDPDYELVGTAGNGLEGLQLVQETEPDLVIMDIQMPEMNGLDMLEHLRKGGYTGRAVVLTAYSDFDYAKRAIGMNIDNYLLKPIKIQELKETLRNIRTVLEKEKGIENMQEKYLSLPQIFRGCALAEFPVDEELNKLTTKEYGLDISEPLEVFSIWLGKHYSRQVAEVRQIVETYTGRVADYSSTIIESARQHQILVFLYHCQDREKIQKRYVEMLIPAICRAISPIPVFMWAESDGMAGLQVAYEEIIANREWNLSFPRGTLLKLEDLKHIQTVPLKYPSDVEEKMRRMMTERNQEGFLEALEQFIRMYRNGSCHPNEIREACIRFIMAILSLAKTLGRTTGLGAAQEIVGSVSKAVTWNEIRGIMEQLYEKTAVQEKSEAVSDLVKRAGLLIEEYYNQGITLDELAQKLKVSEEYLSSQFKKETGMSFTETVRRYRIDKIKELLVHSSLKLNQIADMVGYSDPKYMSRVFKEEVGVLPAEFRKNFSS